MKLQLNSDFHLEFHGYPDFKFEGDILILAGDIATDPFDLLKFIRQINNGKPIIFVLGNHEYYSKTKWSQVYSSFKSVLNEFDNFHLLENEKVTIDGVNFVGSTFWTDFRKGTELANCALGMNDFRFIPIEQALLKHNFAVEWFYKNVKEGDVVITHHAPTFQSINPKYYDSNINGGFASDSEDLINNLKPSLWLHGHVHDNVDIKINQTRIIANPRGYVNENPNYLNKILEI